MLWSRCRAILFVSMHLIERTCIEPCSKKGAPSPCSASGNGSCEGRRKPKDFRNSGHFFICGECCWLFQRATKPEFLHKIYMLSKISASCRQKIYRCGSGAHTSPDFTTLCPFSFGATGAEGLPNIFLTYMHTARSLPIAAQLPRNAHPDNRSHSSQHSGPALGPHKHSGCLWQFFSTKPAPMGLGQLTYLLT